VAIYKSTHNGDTEAQPLNLLVQVSSTSTLNTFNTKIYYKTMLEELFTNCHIRVSLPGNIIEPYRTFVLKQAVRLNARDAEILELFDNRRDIQFAQVEEEMLIEGEDFSARKQLHVHLLKKASAYESKASD